ncbi:MAG TPA: hypothetical protein VN841_10925 [Bryobacteraceae bacterium]|nr:hypothetical protein [Bryobacteraceae bacterium]
MSKTFLAVCVVVGLAAGIAGAQPVGGGIKLGVPFTDAFQSISTQSFQASPQRFVVGPYVEVRLPAQLSVEVDALHQALDFSLAGVSLNSGSWEFPVVVKHRMLAGPFKPYFEAGLAFSRLSDVSGLVVNHTQNFGIVGGGGVEIHLLNLKLSPEIRYDGWFFRNFDTSAPGAATSGVFPAVLQSHRNQLAFLVGFGF